MTSLTETVADTTAPKTDGSDIGPSGARSSALIAGASVVAIAANYLFLLITGRVLGSHDYGALAALLGFLTIVLIPTGALQLAVSREVSRLIAGGDTDAARAFARAAVRLALLATLPLVGLGLALVVPLRELLRIESTQAVVITALGLAAAWVLPIGLGILQGYQRFHAVAGFYLLPFVLRLAFVAVLAAIGFGLDGAVLAAVAGGLASAALLIGALRDSIRAAAGATRPALGPFFRYLGPVVLGLIGVAVLTNVDILVVKARFGGDEAGEYAAASAFARVAFFLPATILAVLFPRTAARQAQGREAGDILGRSIIVTAAFCATLMLAYAAMGRGLVHTSFGADFAGGGELLVPFTLAMTLYALTNLLAGFHLSRAEPRFAWIVAAAVPAQVLLLAVVPGGTEGVIWANVGVGAALLVAHELVVGTSVPALRAGAARFGLGIRSTVGVGREAAVVLAALTVLVGWLTWPLFADFGSAFLGSVGADASGTIWWLWQLQQEGAYHLFGTSRHVLSGAPIGYAEANALNGQWLLPYYPAYLLTGLVGEVAAYNLVVVGGYVLSGAVMYALVRYLGCAPLVAMWAAAAYVLFPAHLARVEHASLTHFEVLALALLAAAAASARTTWLRISLVGGAVLAAWLTSGYFGVMASIGVCAFALGAALVADRSRARLLFGTGGVVLATTAAFGLLLLVAGAQTGAVREREAADLSVYGVRPAELVVPGRNLFLGERLEEYHAERSHGANPSETANYLGLLTIGLAVAGLIAVWRRRRELDARTRTAVAGLVAVLGVSLLFSTPSPLVIAGLTLEWTPSRLLWELVAEFRVVSRWTAMTMTALVPLAALGLQAGWMALARTGRRWAPPALAAAAIAISIGELAYPLEEKVTRTHEVPPEYVALERTPEGIVAEYPLRRSDIFNFWQREHGRPLVNGAPTGTYADDVTRSLVDPGAPGTAEQLSLLGVTAVVTHPNALELEGSESSAVVPASWGPGYALVDRFADGTSVWRVTAEPAPALPSLPNESFYFPVVKADGSIAYPLTGQTGHFELRSVRPQVVRLAFDAWPLPPTTELHIAGKGRVVVPLAGRTAVSVVVRLPAGRSRLDLRVEPTPESGKFPLEVSGLRTERTTDAPALTASS